MSRESDQTDSYTVTVVHETPDAVLVSDGDDPDAPEVWLPKSRVGFPRNLRKGQVITVDVPAWLAEEKGLA